MQSRGGDASSPELLPLQPLLLSAIQGSERGEVVEEVISRQHTSLAFLPLEELYEPRTVRSSSSPSQRSDHTAAGILVSLDPRS
jgi:hypothetical protein